MPPETDYEPFAAGQHNRALGPPRVVRNGLPVRFYRYDGTGQAMSEQEAGYWLRQIRRLSEPVLGKAMT